MILARRAILATMLLAVAGSAWAGYISAPPGYSVHDTVFEIPAGGYPAGFDVLPDGSFVVHTGQHILKVAKDGESNILYSYPEAVFGSILTIDHAGGRIFFGESSNGTIGAMGLDGSDPEIIATVSFNFDLELNSRGQIFVVWTPSFWDTLQTTNVSLLDPETGMLDLILQVAGPTGSIAFDRFDNLIYGTVAGVWGQQGGEKLVRFTAAQVAGAVGETHLTVDDGDILVDDVDSPYDIAVDTAGKICFTSTVSTPSTLWRLNGDSVVAMSWTDPEVFHYMSVLQWHPDARGFSVLVGGVYGPDWSPVGVISTLVRGRGRPVW